MPLDYLAPDNGRGEEDVTQVPTDVGDLSADDVGDLSADCLEQLLEDACTGHTAFMEDRAQNEETQGSVVDFASGRKFNEVGPIEAAAAEVIMRIKP